MLCTIDSQSDRQKQVTRFANDVTQASRVTSSASAAVCEQEVSSLDRQHHVTFFVDSLGLLAGV